MNLSSSWFSYPLSCNYVLSSSLFGSRRMAYLDCSFTVCLPWRRSRSLLRRWQWCRWWQWLHQRWSWCHCSLASMGFPHHWQMCHTQCFQEEIWKQRSQQIGKGQLIGSTFYISLWRYLGCRSSMARTQLYQAWQLRSMRDHLHMSTLWSHSFCTQLKLSMVQGVRDLGQQHILPLRLHCSRLKR